MSSSIWHKREEIPKDFCDVVLAGFRTGSYCVFFSPFHNVSFDYEKWCYLDDLIAQADKAERLEKENEAMRDEFEVWHGNYECVVGDKERLQKAVDLAVDALNDIQMTYDVQYANGTIRFRDAKDIAVKSKKEIKQLIKGNQ